MAFETRSMPSFQFQTIDFPIQPHFQLCRPYHEVPNIHAFFVSKSKTLAAALCQRPPSSLAKLTLVHRKRPHHFASTTQDRVHDHGSN